MKITTSKKLLICLILATGTALVSACNEAPTAASASDTAQSKQARSADAALPVMKMHKDPNCGCCVGWARHMQAAGFIVETHDSQDMLAVKQRLGIDGQMMSCHTSEVGGYVIEGHVPAADIKRLLADRPSARGLVVPGMPIGSPGMESPDGYQQPYTVELLGHDAQLTPYATHP